MNGTSILWVLCLFALASCATTPAPQFQTGQDAGSTSDGVVRVDNTIMHSVRARPDIDLRGSMSNTVYLRAVDRRAAQQSKMIESNRVSNTAEIRRLGRRWGTIVREGLETVPTGDAAI